MTSRIHSLTAAILLTIGSAFAHVARAPERWTTQRELQVATAADGARYVSDELLLTWSASAARGSILQALEARGAEVIGEVRRGRLLRVRLSAGSDALMEAPGFSALPGVEYAELNGIGAGGALLAPNDTFFGSQWHHENTASNPGTAGADIESVAAWDLEIGSPDVTIAVLDTGIDFVHPEFLGRTLPGYDFVNNDPDPTADHPHGILVTGLLAANANNMLGGAGVDWGCMVLPVKVLDSNNAGATFDLIAGIDYSAAERADIVSMSLINYPPIAALQTALANARADGCILIACAGNGGTGNADISWPGASSTTISIGATTSSDARASFSGTGTALDFVAPGSTVRTTSTSYGNTVVNFSGCSAATPVAAGIVGLLKARFPLLTQGQTYELLRLGAEDQVGPSSEDTPGRDDFFGHGRLNAFLSLQALDANPGVLGYYCSPSVPNTSGDSARILASGSVVAVHDDLTLEAVDLPPNQFGYFLMGAGMGTFTPPGSAGLICIDGAVIARLFPPILNSGSGGSFSDSPGTTGLPAVGAIVSGETWNFQAWFRDHPTNNFTDALSVTFL